MIVLGRVVAPYGVKGWVKVQPYGDDPLSWSTLPQWWLGESERDEEPAWRAVELADCREHSGLLAVRFVGIGDRTQAEQLKGALVGVPRELLPDLADEEFYWGDLVGLAVSNEENRLLGCVTGLISAGAHDVLVVQDEAGQERLLPFVEAVVKRVDRATGMIRVAWQADW
ncbi:MAG: ribosome maturation factor RimM [Rhodocyclaceae bacterium]